MKVLDLNTQYEIAKNQALKILREDGCIIIQTDTLFAISCSFTSKAGIEKIFQIKKRQKEKMMPILVDSLKMGMRYARFNQNAKKLATKYWPGALTLILPAQEKCSKIFLNQDIAIRIANNPELNDIIRVLNAPIIGTSANISGSKNLTEIKDIEEIFHEKIELIIINSKLNFIKEHSTIVKLKDDRISILREGAIKTSEIYSI